MEPDKKITYDEETHQENMFRKVVLRELELHGLLMSTLEIMPLRDDSRGVRIAFITLPKFIPFLERCSERYPEMVYSLQPIPSEPDYWFLAAPPLTFGQWLMVDPEGPYEMILHHMVTDFLWHALEHPGEGEIVYMPNDARYEDVKEQLEAALKELRQKRDEISRKFQEIVDRRFPSS